MRKAWQRRLGGFAAIGLIALGLAPAVARAAASSPIGASINLAGLETVGTGTATVATLPTPYSGNTLLILGGQQLDTPEAVADATAELTALKAVHGNVARITVPWTMLETNFHMPGATPDFNPLAVERVTAVLDAAHALGIQVIFQISNTPCGRSSYWSSPPSNSQCSTLGTWATYPATDESDLSGAVAKVIGLWGADIYAIEVWNEPNEQYFLSNQTLCDASAPADLYGPSSDSTRAAAYVPIVKAVWQAVKASAYPGILVVAGSIGLSDTTFLQDLYNDGIAGYYDAISVHPYQVQLAYQPTPTSCAQRGTSSALVATTQDPAVPFSDALFSFQTGVPAMHNVMVGNGDSTHPLFLTEFGFPTCVTGSTVAPLERSGSFNYAGWCVSLTQQENWLNESINMVRGWSYVGAATIYTLRDPPDGESPVSLNNFGLMRHDFTPKPSYAAAAIG